MSYRFIKHLTLACFILVWAPSRAQVIELRAELLAQYSIGLPDTVLGLKVATQLADAALAEGNLSIARNAVMLLTDLGEQYSRATPRQAAEALLTDVRVTYQINRRNPAGLTRAEAALAAARKGNLPDLELAALYELARFQRGRRMTAERRKTLELLYELAQGKPDYGKWLGQAQLEQARDLIQTGEYENGAAGARLAGETFGAYAPELRYLAYDLLATAQLSAGDFEQSKLSFDTAMLLYFPVAAVDADNAVQPITEGLTTFFEATSLLNHRSRLFRRMERPDLALVDYQTLIKMRGRQRAENVVETSRIRQSRIVMEFMSEAIECYYELLDDDPENIWKALSMSEQMKAYSLLTNLEQRKQNGIDTTAVSLQRRIAQLERAEPAGIPTSPTLALLELQLSDYLTKQPQAEIEPFDYSTDNMKALVANLEGGMLQYATGYDHSHLFFVNNRGELSMHRVANPGKTLNGIIKWRSTIAASAFKTKSLRPITVQDSLDQAFFAEGRDLLREVLPGVNPDSLPADLLIIPDQLFNFLPFAALPLDSINGAFAYPDLRYLIDHHRMRYAYSLMHQRALDEEPQPAMPYALAAFAPEFNGEASSSEVIAARGTMTAPLKAESRSIPGLSPLRYNLPEAETITDLFEHSVLFSGPNASLEAFTNHLREADIIHLSSHGAMSPRFPRYSFVAFNQPTEQLQEKELMYYNDLAGYGLKAELVVLSACETNMGMVAPGESAATMAAAFIDAGAQSVVSNLWSVDDKATFEQMTDFYQGLSQGESRLDALTNAQRQQRSSGAYTHPFYWSGATLYGRAGPVDFSGKTGYWWYLLAGAVTLVGLFWWRQRG